MEASKVIKVSLILVYSIHLIFTKKPTMGVASLCLCETELPLLLSFLFFAPYLKFSQWVPLSFLRRVQTNVY